METLLCQKDCKIKHNFLITKHLEEENRGKKKEKIFYDLGANGLGIIGFHFPAIRSTACRSYRG